MQSSSDRSPRAGTCPNRTVTEAFIDQHFISRGALLRLVHCHLSNSLTSRSAANHGKQRQVFAVHGQQRELVFTVHGQQGEAVLTVHGQQQGVLTVYCQQGEAVLTVHGQQQGVFTVIGQQEEAVSTVHGQQRSVVHRSRSTLREKRYSQFTVNSRKC